MGSSYSCCYSRERDRGDFFVEVRTIEHMPEQFGGPTLHEGVYLVRDGFEVPGGSHLKVTLWMNPDANARTEEEIAAVKGDSTKSNWSTTYNLTRLKLLETELSEDSSHPEWVSKIKIEYVTATDPKQMPGPIANMRDWGEGAVLEALVKKTFDIQQSQEDQVACQKVVDQWRTKICQNEGTYPGTKKYQIGSFAS